MANRRTINRDTLPELLARHQAGESLRSLKTWLASNGVETGIETIRRELAKAGQAAQEHAPVVIIAGADPEEIPDRLRVLRYEVAQERGEARKHRSSDWKRYHSAVRMTVELLKIEAKPAPVQQPGTTQDPTTQPAPPARPADTVTFN